MPLPACEVNLPVRKAGSRLSLTLVRASMSGRGRFDTVTAVQMGGRHTGQHPAVQGVDVSVAGQPTTHALGDMRVGHLGSTARNLRPRRRRCPSAAPCSWQPAPLASPVVQMVANRDASDIRALGWANRKERTVRRSGHCNA